MVNKNNLKLTMAEADSNIMSCEKIETVVKSLIKQQTTSNRFTFLILISYI